MLDFVNRLTVQQIMEFFYGVGSLRDVKTSASAGMKDIYFTDRDGKTFWFSVADNYICADGFNKTSEDWKFYMLKIFGDEYLKSYAEAPVENNFIDKLTLQDIQEFIEIGSTSVERVEEVEAFREGTRRFKITITKPTHFTKEIVIGPHMSFCIGISSMTETAFVKFFVKKCGMDFINYYIDVEKRICDTKVEAYKKRCEGQVKDKLNYMVRIWEKDK